MPQARAYSRKRFLLGVPVIYASTLLRYTVSSDSERRHTRDRTQRKALRSRGLLINGHLSETFEPLLKAAAALDGIMYTADAISDLHGGLNQRERASPLFCHWEHKKSLVQRAYLGAGCRDLYSQYLVSGASRAATCQPWGSFE